MGLPATVPFEQSSSATNSYANRSQDVGYDGAVGELKASVAIPQGIAVLGGSLRFDRSVRVEGAFSSAIGFFEGCRVVIVGVLGKLTSTVRALEMHVQGRVEGDIAVARTLHVYPGATVAGTVCAANLVVHEGAVLDADLVIGASQE